MTNKITFYGDTHCAWGDLRRAMRTNPDSDMHIQVGDFGAFHAESKHFPPDNFFEAPLHFIRGNHDNPLLLEHLEDNTVATNVRYIPDATHMDLGYTQLNFLGGGLSIDKHLRTEFLDWWSQEIPNKETIDRFAALPKADIWVTHVAPTNIADALLRRKSIHDPLQQSFQRMTEILDGPKTWIFGHYHEAFDVTINGTRFFCVPCVHDWDVENPAHDGFTLEFET